MLHNYKTKTNIFFKVKHFFIHGHGSFFKDSKIALLIRLILKQREQYSMHIPKMITPVGLNTEGDRVSFFNFN